MDSLFAIAPAIIWFGATVGMMSLIFQFDRLRWTRAKDYLGRFWSSDRRRVLHLEKQNGFFFFVDKLIEWSDLLLKFSWLAIIFALGGGLESTLIGGLIITLSFLVRFSCLTVLASQRVRRFTMPLDYDGFGVYARTASDWRVFRDELRQPLITSSIATLILIYTVFDLFF